MLTRPLRYSCALVIGTVLCAVVAGGGCASHDRAGGAKGSSAQARRRIPENPFESAAADPPIASDTRFAAGQLAESRGSLAQAAEQYRQALKANPKHIEAM